MADRAGATLEVAITVERFDQVLAIPAGRVPGCPRPANTPTKPALTQENPR